MEIISKLYIFLYFFYSYFGYNFIHRIGTNKKIDCALLNKKAYAFIGKRLVMLSHITFLYSAYFIEYPLHDRYINSLLLHFIVNIGYFTMWGICEKSTTFMHLFWSFPVIIHKNNYNNNIIININNYSLSNENIIFFIFLLAYSQNIKYIYTPRMKNIDKD